ncbi:hypothetical protein RUM43_000872 [Polyplax serrata]|uniref:ATP-dependent RNA helicase SUV3 homolog, mitochondrial n=1 Tax=Polyplax serrata TaxID=468196 RepID=A0AAN8XPQ5_POLSC
MKILLLTGRVFSLFSRRAKPLKKLTAQDVNLTKNLRCLTCTSQSKQKDKSSSVLFTPIPIKVNNDELPTGEELTGKLDKVQLVKVINAFYRKPELKLLTEENDLDDCLLQRGFISFRNYCLQTPNLPPDLHITLADIIRGASNVLDIFPYFLRHLREIFPHLECMEDLKKIGDLRTPANWYPEARKEKRKIIFHAGPTNSGKTYHAIKRFFEAESGIYCGPLKLLAVEIFNKSNENGVQCDLITGEEIVHARADGDLTNHVSCTVEMCSMENSYDVAVIDEIQMIRDVQRGWAWTRALLGLKAKEIHLCGEESAIDLIDSILCTTNEELEVNKYKRLTELELDSPVEEFKNVQPGDCIVCFSKKDIFKVTDSLKDLEINVGVIYGTLPPGAKLAQCKKFNDPDNPCNVLVATDAIGMGLNLSIRRIIFYSLMKPVMSDSGDIEIVQVPVSQALQIAGRAGRYGSQYSKGFVTTFKKSDIGLLQSILSKTPEPATSAGILPTVDQIELYSYYLPHSTLSNLMEILISLSTIDDSLYFICDTNDFRFFAEMIEHISLPLRVKYVFCSAPINKKSQFTSSVFLKFAKMYSANNVITFNWICQVINWPVSTPTTIKELVHMEAIHDALDLYLWLSYRFPDFFPDGDSVKSIQRELDRIIEFGMVEIFKSLKNWEKHIEATKPQRVKANLRVTIPGTPHSNDSCRPDDALRDAEELQNSERVLNSGQNSFVTCSKGSEHSSKNASKVCSRGPSGRTTRESSPGIRSGNESMRNDRSRTSGRTTREGSPGIRSGNESMRNDRSRPSSKYASESSHEGIPLAVNFFESHLQTGSPLANCSQPQGLTSDSRYTTYDQFTNFINTGSPLPQPNTSGNQHHYQHYSINLNVTSNAQGTQPHIGNNTVLWRLSPPPVRRRSKSARPACHQNRAPVVPGDSPCSCPCRPKSSQTNYSCQQRNSPNLMDYKPCTSEPNDSPSTSLQYKPCTIPTDVCPNVCKPPPKVCPKPDRLEYIPPRGRPKTVPSSISKGGASKQDISRPATRSGKLQGNAGQQDATSSGSKFGGEAGRGQAGGLGKGQQDASSLGKGQTGGLGKGQQDASSLGTGLAGGLGKGQQDASSLGKGQAGGLGKGQQDASSLGKGQAGGLGKGQQDATSLGTGLAGGLGKGQQDASLLGKGQPGGLGKGQQEANLLGKGQAGDTYKGQQAAGLGKGQQAAGIGKGQQDTQGEAGSKSGKGGTGTMGADNKQTGNAGQSNKNVGFQGSERNNENKLISAKDGLAQKNGMGATDRNNNNGSRRPGPPCKQQLGDIMGPSNYVEKFTDCSPNAQGSRAPSKSVCPSRDSPKECGSGSPNRSYGPGNISSTYEPSTGDPRSPKYSRQSQYGSRGAEDGTGVPSPFLGSSMGSAKSPGQRSGSPGIQFGSSGQRSGSPGPMSYHTGPMSGSGSPGRYSRSSGRQDESPTQFSRSPSQYRESPTRYGESPAQYSESPTRYGESPTRYGESPVRYGESPPQFSESRAVSPSRGECPSDYSNSAQVSARTSRLTQGSPRYTPTSDMSSRMPQSYARFASPLESEYPSEVPQNSSRFLNFNEPEDHVSVTPTRFPQYETPFSESQNRFATGSPYFSDNLDTIREGPVHSSEGDYPANSYGQMADSGACGPPCPGKESTGGRALKSLSRLNAKTRDSKPRSSPLGQENSFDFLSFCDPAPRAAVFERKLPKKPDLNQEQIDMLVKCESQDVESAVCLAMDDKKLFKKPCPKQEKAQMSVKHLMHAHEMQSAEPCPKEYGPLIDPDPDDVTPDVVAAMLFAQEQTGLKMDSCPREILRHLYPKEKSPCEGIRESTVSILDTSPKDEEELIEKSASVPFEGVSHSAYTSTMKQKSDDFESNQVSLELNLESAKGKREYVLVSKKPQRSNEIQFRGNDPSWFPGYFSIFPTDNSIKSIESPSDVFTKAWAATNPGNVPASDLTVIE